MLKARIRLDWGLSPSSDVITQKVKINVDTVSIVDQDVDKNISSFVFVANEHSLVSVEVAPFDGTHFAVPAVLSFQVPDLGAPLPISDLRFTIEEVFEE